VGRDLVEAGTLQWRNLFKKRNSKSHIRRDTNPICAPVVLATVDTCILRKPLESICVSTNATKCSIFPWLGETPPGGYPREGIYVDGIDVFVDARNIFDDADEGTEYADQLDPFHDVQRQLYDVFVVGDRLREDTPHIEENPDADKMHSDEISDKLHRLEELYVHASRPLYTGLNVSVISATTVLINMAVIHGVLNAYVDELLKHLATVLLP
jgi:hypothetical protein